MEYAIDLPHANNPQTYGKLNLDSSLAIQPRPQDFPADPGCPCTTISQRLQASEVVTSTTAIEAAGA